MSEGFPCETSQAVVCFVNFQGFFMARSYLEFAAKVCIGNGELKIGPGKEERGVFPHSAGMVTATSKIEEVIEANKDRCFPTA